MARHFSPVPVVDQAALHGLLKKVRDLGMPLVSVSPVEPGQADQIRHQIVNGYKHIGKEFCL